MILPALLTIQAMKLPALPTLPQQDQIILMSMTLVYLLSLLLAFVYFFGYNTFPKKNLINEKQDQPRKRRGKKTLKILSKTG